MDAVALVLIGTVGAAIVMFAMWLWHLRLRNVGVVDLGWTVCVAGLSVFYALAGPGQPTRRGLIATMVGLWGARLAFYLLRDRIRAGRPEDPRYVDLRDRGSVAAAYRFLPFFEAQALLAVFFSIPALIASQNAAPGLAVVEVAAVVLWMFAVTGESIADLQLERFKSDPRNRGKTCRVGLWRYSRHPNYFFEWLIWVAYALYALGSPYGWIAIACPAAMLYLLFRVTGIPATEAQSLRSKGDDYRAYQRNTSVFVPWFPKGS